MPEGLAGRTLFITGGSRGIGLAIALRAARDGANVALLAKTAEPHPKLPGTIYTAAEEIEAAGGTALPIVGDVRDADSVAGAVEQAAERFGGIDILVNNASAISLTPIEQTEPKRYDLMQGINVRGTFLAIRACIPHLKRSDNGHILSLSPPINLDPALARRPRRLHALEVRHDADHAVPRRRSCARRASPPTRCGRARSSRPPRSRTCSAATRR